MTHHTNLESLYPQERDRLAAFRRATADLYRTLGADIGRGLAIGSKGRNLIPEKHLRAGATALRLVLLDGEKANFGKVIDALRLLKDPVVNRRLETITTAWQRAEEGQITFAVGDGFPLSGKRIRDAWLYGRVSHHRDEWANDLLQLRESGELAEMALQVSILSHARLMLALDAVIAEVLGEAPIWLETDPDEERFF